MKEEAAPQSEDPRECWCCGGPSPCRCESAGKCSDCDSCRDHCRCFSSDCLDELEHDAARPVRLRNPVLDPPDINRRSRTCSAGGTEGRAMRPEVAGLIAGATVTLSSVLFGLAAKDTNPWFVVWVVLSATIVVGLALSVAR